MDKSNKVQALRKQFENLEKKPKPELSASIIPTGKGDHEIRPILSTSTSSNSSKVSSYNNNTGDVRRSGIYKCNNNSLSLPSGFQEPKLQVDNSTSCLKRRPIVLDLEQCDRDLFMEEHEFRLDKCASGDTLSGSSYSDSCDKIIVNPKIHTCDEDEEKEEATTPTSSSASSGSGYGKVKRSNAFRNKDPVGATNNELKTEKKSKIVLERVKSLDNSQNIPVESVGGTVAQRTSSLSMKTLPFLPPLPGKAVNVVTPYKVSDLFSQPKYSGPDYAVPSRCYRPLPSPPVQPVTGAPPLPKSSPPFIINVDEYGIAVLPRPLPNSYVERCSSTQWGECEPQSYIKGLIEQADKNYAAYNEGNSDISTTITMHPFRVAAPEKPPRTFLYDILSEPRNTTSKKLNKDMVTKKSTCWFQNTPEQNLKLSSSGAQRQGSSSSSSSTVTYKPPHMARSELSVSTATVRQNLNNKSPAYGSQSKKNSTLSPLKACHANNTNANHPIWPPGNQRMVQHPPLVRSKTESQLLIKNNGNRNMSLGNTAEGYSSATVVGRSHNDYGYRALTKLGNQQGSIQLNTHPENFGFASRAQKDSTSNNLIGKSQISYGYTRGLGYSNQVVYPHHSHRPQVDQLLQNSNLEKSKSDWSLHHISSNFTPYNANTSMNDGKNRNTFTNAGGTSTGHPSLESTASSISSQPSKKPGIQQSIQNLVNQLFSTSTMKDATSSTDSGIQLGSESLSSCDTPVGDSTTDTGDSDCENDGETSNNARQVVEARKGYVRRVSSIRVQELGASINMLINKSRLSSQEPLFECLLVVGLTRDPYTGVYNSYIRDKFPPNTKLPSGVEQFCFPDSLEWPCHEGTSAQFYTLAITDQRGSRKFGCCYRILPEGAKMCIPITYCCISSHRAIGFYKEVLREITQRHGYNGLVKRFWTEELYKKSFPVQGGHITITEPPMEDLYQSTQNHQLHGHDPTLITSCYNYSLSPPKTVTIKRRVDPRLDEGDLVTLFMTLDVTTIIKIFGSLLLERKVVLISRALSTLSLCVEAFESMLYPFSWQHTFVPILPLSMTDVLDAPAPFLIGVLRSSQTPWDKTLDEGMVVDLDHYKVISCVGDEGTILPKRVHRKLRDALQGAMNLADQKDSTKNVLISECFIRMFVETMGHHANHIVVQQDGLKIFERESFVKSSDSKAVQNFLEWFSETSMFHEFTQLRLKDTKEEYGLFEQRVVQQLEQNHPNQNSTGTPFKNAKTFMNRTRPFGNWLKDAFIK